MITQTTKTTFLTFFFSFLLAALSFGQKGTIKGVIKTADGQPAEFVTIALEGTNKGTLSDNNGAFEIKNVAAGNYVLIASFVGLEKKKIPVAVKADETTVVPDILLAEDAKTLNEVVISATKNTKEESYVAKMPLKNPENPQVYNTVSAETMKQQGITNYDDALRNVPGVARTWESTGRDGDGAAYFAIRGLEGQAALVNGLPGITNGNLDPANVEEIQVLKGPSGTLFGARATSYSSYGGLINTITKKPYYTMGGEVGYQIGSFGLSRFTADINTPLSQTEKIALRFNTAYHTEGSFQDAGFKKSLFIAPSLAYEINSRLKFLVVTEILQEERAVAPVFFHSNRSEPLTFTTTDELDLNNKLSFTSNDLTIRNPRSNVQAQMLYKLSDNWNSQTVVSRSASGSYGYYSYIWADNEGDNDFGQYITYINQSRVTTDIQQNFTGDFKIGGLRNRLLIGLDYFSQESTNNSLGYAFMRNVTPQGGENFVDPYSGDTLAPAYLSAASVDNLLASTSAANSQSLNSTYSTYISDVLNLTPGLALMASVRADYFDSRAEKADPSDDYSQFALSPKFGVVYQPVIDKVSIFANYQNSFNNVAPVQVADTDGSNPRLKSFKPEQANQWEVGVKTSLFKNRLLATASYYDIEVTNKVIGDPNNFFNFVQGGAVSSKGFELDVTANLFEGFNLIAGYSHNETQNLRGNAGDFYGEPGRAPGGQGPQDQVNFWATYKVKKGGLRNFGLAFGGNYASAYRVIDNSTVGVFDLPAYTVLNAGVFYTAYKFRFSLNVNNLLNTEYYIGYWSVNPQKPVNLVASLIFKI